MLLIFYPNLLGRIPLFICTQRCIDNWRDYPELAHRVIPLLENRVSADHECMQENKKIFCCLFSLFGVYLKDKNSCPITCFLPNMKLCSLRSILWCFLSSDRSSRSSNVCLFISRLSRALFLLSLIF